MRYGPISLYDMTRKYQLVCNYNIMLHLPLFGTLANTSSHQIGHNRIHVYMVSIFHTNKINIKMNSPETNEVLNKLEAKRNRHKRLFQVIYTIILLVTIFILWVSWSGTIVVALLFKPTPTNISRPYVELLNHTITTNTSILPSKCRSGNEYVVHSNITITCPTNYVFNCTMCVPICGLWHPYGESYYIAYRVISIFIGVADFVSSLIGLIVMLKVPGVFKIPRINYLFMFISAVVYSFCLAAIAISGPHNFFCQQRNEDYSIVSRDPPVIVSVVGFVSHLAFLSFYFWFLCNTINLLIIVFWPQLRITESRRSRIIIFTIEAIISFGIPLLIPSIYLIIFKRYSFLRTPFQLFTISIIATLVFIIVPLLLLTAFSLTIIAISIYKLKMRELIFMENRPKVKLKGFEIRFIIFAICIGVLASVAIIEASYSNILNPIFNLKLEEFWSCLTVQNNVEIFRIQSDICLPEYRAFFFPIVTFIRYFAFSSWAILLFVILTTKDTRNVWKKIFTNILRSLINRARTLVVNIHVVCLQSWNRNRSQENDRDVIVATTEL